MREWRQITGKMKLAMFEGGLEPGHELAAKYTSEGKIAADINDYMVRPDQLWTIAAVHDAGWLSRRTVLQDHDCRY